MEDKEYEYETIFARLFGEHYRISSIIAAGGKLGVKEAFQEFGEFDKNDSNKVNVFIVDGDFDRYIRSEEMIVNPHFIYLKYYNVENYFYYTVLYKANCQKNLTLLEKNICLLTISLVLKGQVRIRNILNTY